ncbi:MAG TPA: response regulator [Synechococcales cyanobacterium M55_K2018_004]|nr:response regulator [Synechococcales cyanobacterium M55_K2018_004]
MKISVIDLVEPVPVLAATATLETVLNQLAKCRSEWAIALDPQGQPTYAIALPPLLAQVLETLACPQIATEPAVTPLLAQPVLQAGEDGAVWLERLATLSLADAIEPEALLRQTTTQRWAVVDAAGTCLGLLHRAVLEWCCFKASDQCPASNLLVQAIPPYPPPCPDQVSAAQGLMSLPLANPSVLAALLDHLPIPVMVQTPTGQVVLQNSVWRVQIGDLSTDSPGLSPTLRESAALIDSELERPVAERLSWSLVGARSPFTLLSTPAERGVLTLDSPPIAPACQSGADHNTCICTCESQTGPARVWEFVKVPLQTGDILYPLWLVVAKDITEQHQLKQDLAMRNAELVQLNRFKDEFLACISHELKTPLTAVLGLSSLLKDQMLGPLNERQTRYARLIYQSGRQLMMIVNDILDLTRIEANQLELMPVPVSIEQACLQAYEQARQIQPIETQDSPLSDVAASSEVAQASFSLTIQPGLETFIADELRLRQMLANLLSNALKFTPAEGKIGLDVELWDSWLAFTVWDTGIGIAPEKQHLIFQKFQQLENPLTRRFEGTGLGLALTQRLAQLQGGDVSFVSVEGKGSRFTLLLPAVPAASQQDSRACKRDSTTSVSTDRRLALVVESHLQQVEEVVTQLEALGCRVAIARSGTEALEKIRRLRPAVVLLSPYLPLLSGWDVLTLVKANRETQAIPVVMVGTSAEQARAMASGADDFVLLPLPPLGLKDVLAPFLKPLAPSPPDPLPHPAILTILHLRLEEAAPEDVSQRCNDRLPIDLPHLLQPYPCRVLQVDDLEQAELLVRVWKPQVVLLDGILADPVATLQPLKEYPLLASLPFVTLTPENTQAANQVKGLSVYPCLAPLLPSDGSDQPDISALLEVIQVAAGLA